jgi:hypothetical protein
MATTSTRAGPLRAGLRQSSTTTRSSRNPTAWSHHVRTRAGTRHAQHSGSSEQAAEPRRQPRIGRQPPARRPRSSTDRSPPARWFRRRRATGYSDPPSGRGHRLAKANARGVRTRGTGPGGRPCRPAGSTTPARARWTEPRDRRTAAPPAHAQRPRPSCRQREGARDDDDRPAGRTTPASTRAAGRAPYCPLRGPASAATSPARCPNERVRRRARADAGGRRQTDAYERTPWEPPVIRDRRTAVTDRPALMTNGLCGQFRSNRHRSADQTPPC